MVAYIFYLYTIALCFSALEGRVGIVTPPFGRNAVRLLIRGGIAKGDSVKTNGEEPDLQTKRKEIFVLRENALGGGDDDDDDDRKGYLDQDDDGEEDDEEASLELEEEDTESDDATEVSPPVLVRSPAHDQIRDIWKTFIHPTPKLSDLQLALRSLGVPTNNTEENLYRQLLGQFVDPLAVGGKRVLWLDQETVLRLKGAAVLALNPHMLPLNNSSSVSNNDSSSSSSSVLVPPRGVRVSMAPAFPSYSAGGGPSGVVPLEGTQIIQSALVKALCHSVGSARVSLTKENVNSVRQLAVEQGLMEPIEDHQILMALMDALDNEASTVVLQSEELSSWLSHDSLTDRVLTAAFSPDRAGGRPYSSRLFFMVLPEQAPLTVGQVPPSFHVPSTPSTQQQEGGQQQQLQHDSDGPPMPHFFGSSPQGGSPFFPPSQFHSLDPNTGGPPPSHIPMYTVVVQNGTARVIPSGPPHLLPPPPPPEVIQKLVNEAMKRVPQNRKGATFMGSLFARPPPLPPLSPEEESQRLEDAKAESTRLKSELTKKKDQLKKAEALLDKKLKTLPKPFRERLMKQMMNNSTSAPTMGTTTATPVVTIKPQVESSDSIVARSFEEITVRPPSDHQLKVKWEKIVDEEMCRRIGKVNKNTLRSELKRSGLQTASGVARGLREVLRRQVLSEEEVRLALRMAVRLQAGKYNVTAVLMQAGGGNDNNAAGAESVSATVEATAATSSTASVPVSSPSELVLSFWALDTALRCTINAGGAPMGRRGLPVQLNRSPRSRSAEEMQSLIATLDKHEKALVSNVISPQEIGVTYDMIGGLDSVKDILRQSITYPLKYPKLYEEGVASEAVKGVLLFGPPGTGKTMLAKAVATEGGATFLTIDAATIENKWLGESEKNAKAVFSLARRLAPCVIYLDEVDSVLSSRESGDDSSHGTLTAVKTTLMQEWDGLRTTKDRVVVIASTNRPFDLDEAVLRRLPRRIMVDLPDLTTRREILTVTLRDNRVGADVNLTVLAEQLDGYTGSDIKEVCREAVVRVSHERAHKLEMGNSNSGVTEAVELDELNAPLREVNGEDFKIAMSKLKASVSENGRELKKVLDWNEKFGEVKRSNRRRPASSSQLSMYV